MSRDSFPVRDPGRNGGSLASKGTSLAIHLQLTHHLHAWSAEFLEYHAGKAQCAAVSQTRKENTTSLGINLMRSQVLYRAAQLLSLTLTPVMHEAGAVQLRRVFSLTLSTGAISTTVAHMLCSFQSSFVLNHVSQSITAVTESSW